MNWLFSHLKGDKVIWLVIMLISIVSILAVYSSTSALAFKFREGNTEYFLIKHLILLAAGFGVMYITHLMNYRQFARLSYILLILTIPLLLYTISQGSDAEINSAARWVSIAGQSFQPSDLAKLSIMIYLARVLTEKQEVIKDFQKGFLPIIAVVIVVCALIAPANLSTALLIFICCIVMMFVAGIDLKHIGSFLMIGMMGLMILMFTVKRAATWRHRITDYVERWTDPGYRVNYQTEQANIAIATGGFIGKGAGKSTQRNVLPHPYSDFVYAIIIEEYGMLGGVVVLILYLVLLFRVAVIVTVSKTFGALLAAGLAAMLVIQALINMGVTVGVLPVTGLPLPMISMGGTSILFTGVMLGIILSVSRDALESKENNDITGEAILVS
jgi:cell division protein FtsW